MTVNYTGRDLTARYEALITQFRELVPELSDLNHSNPGIAIIRLLASESDFLSFYIDWVFNALSVDTAMFKQSIINIGKALDTLPKLAPAALTAVVVTRIDGVTGAITVPKYTRFERLDGVGYLTNYEVIIPATEDTATIPVTQGDLVELNVDISEFEVTDYSKLLKYNLGTNVAAYTSVVTDEIHNTEWTEVDSFFRTTANDTDYRLELQAQPYNDVTDTVFLALCKKPTDADIPTALSVTFIRTEGALGNTGTGTITVVPSELQNFITATNPTHATGGGACETIESLRWRIPATARTQRRAVTKEDYETLLSAISGVRYCEILDRDDDPTWPHLHLLMYVIPEGGGDISSQLNALIIDECQAWGHLGDWEGRYILRNFTQYSTNIVGRIGVSTGYQSAAVISAVTSTLMSSYSLDNMPSLKTWAFSDLHACVMSVPGVSWVEFSTPNSTVTAETGQVLTLGSISFVAGS